MAENNDKQMTREEAARKNMRLKYSPEARKATPWNTKEDLLLEKEKEIEAKKAAAEEQRKLEEIDARAIDYKKSEPQSEEEIRAAGAEMKSEALINPALIPMIDKTEFMNTQADLIAATRRYKDEVLGLMEGLSPDLPTAKEHARDLIEKPQVSRGALDELQRRGAVQMEEPEAPSMWNAVTQMLIGTIGQAFQNVSQSSLAAAEAEQVVTVTSANSAAYQAAEFASFKQNRQRVQEINAQLQAKYQDDLIAAMRDYETRADAAQWNYEQQLITAAFDEQRRYYDLMGKAAEFDIAAERIGAEIGLKYLAEKQRVQTANVGIINETRRFNAKMAAEIEGVTMRMIQDNRRFRETLAKQNMQRYGELMPKAAQMAAAIGAQGTVLYDQAMSAFSEIDYTPWSDDGMENDKNLQQQTMMMSNLFNRVQQKVDELYPAGEEKNLKTRSDMIANLTNNILTFARNGIIVKTVSDSNFDALTKNSNFANTLAAGNINLDALDRADFIMPDDSVNPAWRENVAKSQNVALVKIYGNLAETTRPQKPYYAPYEQQAQPEKKK